MQRQGGGVGRKPLSHSREESRGIERSEQSQDKKKKERGETAKGKKSAANSALGKRGEVRYDQSRGKKGLQVSVNFPQKKVHCK